MITIGKIHGERELLEEAKKGSIPIKYCYPDEGGDLWDILRGRAGNPSERYELGQREYNALLNTIPRIKLEQPTNIIHIGPGNGIELPALSEAIDFKEHSYFGVDISKRMLENTAHYQKRIMESMSYKEFLLADVEKEGVMKDICEYTRKIHEKSLILILGQGVLCSNQSFLEYVAESMNENDEAIITIEGDYKARRNEILGTYNLKETEELLNIGLERAGITGGKFLPATFNEEKQFVEKHYETIEGKKYLCLTSWKPGTDRDIERLLSKTGLQAKTITYFPETHPYAAICGRNQNV